MWRAFFIRFVPTLDRKLRILLDWIVTPLVGRDIVEIRPREPFGLRREHYEAGQPIVRQGELGQQLYLIWQGEVEVVRERRGARRPRPAWSRRALRRGRRVPERAADGDRACGDAGGSHRGGAQEARTLSEAVRPFGDVIARRPASQG